MRKLILLTVLLLSITLACRSALPTPTPAPAVQVVATEQPSPTVQAQPTSPPSPSPTRTLPATPTRVVLPNTTLIPLHPLVSPTPGPSRTPRPSATPTLPPQPSPPQPGQMPTPALPTDCRPIAHYTEVFFWDAWIGPQFVLSGDGSRLVFTYPNDDLVAGDSNGVPDVFLYDAGSDAISLVSVSSSGEQQDLPDYDKDGPPTQGRQHIAISADGRYVAFTSEAVNLVSGVELKPGITHLYLRDLSSGQTSLISVDLDGAPLKFSVGAPSISADGRYISFSHHDGFALSIYDRTTQTTREIPLSTTGEEPEEWWIFSAVLSADGQHVAYASEASNLVPGDNNRAADIFVKNLQSGEIVRISVVPDHITTEEGGTLGGPSISADGSVVAFAYMSTEFSDPNLAGTGYIFTYDASTGLTTPAVLVTLGGLPVGLVLWSDTLLDGPQLTSDGSRAIFVSYYYNPQLDNALLGDALIYNRQTGEVGLASLGWDGSDETGYAYHAAISPDGSTVALVATSYIPAAGLDPFPLLICTWP